MNRIALTKLPACALAVGMLAVPTTAGAVDAKGGHYAQSKNNVIIATFDVAGGKVRNFSHNDRCTSYPLEFPAFAFGGNGRADHRQGDLANGHQGLDDLQEDEGQRPLRDDHEVPGRQDGEGPAVAFKR